MILKEIVRYGNENRRIEIINGIVIGSEIDLGGKKERDFVDWSPHNRRSGSELIAAATYEQSAFSLRSFIIERDATRRRLTRISLKMFRSSTRVLDLTRE